eukprot:TRINITY_DN1020_c0_g1_i1.p1 TRINITY_DN1020_c0_g1~~TRINITY_DN1020_c0_g1_i1.p1  ORF type:complete len:1346 (-),score=399.84 TRINITY_DN1020_c0_g1_i1:1124-5134(-)
MTGEQPLEGMDATDIKPVVRVPNVEKTANPLSRLLFSYLTPLMFKGFKRPVKDEDLWDLDSGDTTDDNLKRFDHHWSEQQKLEKPSVPAAIVKAFGSYIALSWIWHAIAVAALLGQTQILNYMIIFLQVPWWNAQNNGLDGYMFALGLGLLALVRSLALYQSQVMSQRAGTRIRNALTASVYRKAMSISTAGRNTTSNGQIVNLVSNDTQRMVEIFMFFNEGIFALPQIIVALALLWQQLGPHALTGFACVLVTIPITGASMKGMTDARGDMLKQTDSRVKITSEVLTAIKVIKFYVWERSFVKTIDKIRDQEMKELFRMSMWRALMNLLIAIMPVMMSLISFLTFSGAGNLLLPNIVFTSLALFNVLRVPMLMLPGLLGMLAQLTVSFNRFGTFLLEEDRTDEVVPPFKSDDPAAVPPLVHVHDASFTWGKTPADVTAAPAAAAGTPVAAAPAAGTPAAGTPASPATPAPAIPAIENLNFEVYNGQILMVVGAVGSGKSALVQSLMGELPRKSGERHLRGSVAYVPQQAWIMNATVRENILFGQPYDAQKYARVIEASALSADLKILPGGDLTEIGERGINLSGGQRQRISIARAVYSNSDIYIMDDPLSAVDAHVAQHLFFKCFREFLVDKSVVLVTNQLQFLSYATTIAVLDKGKQVELGTYDQLMAAGSGFAKLISGHSAGGAAEREHDSQTASKKKLTEDVKEAEKTLADGALVAEELKEEGLVPFRVYLDYFAAGGAAAFALLMFSFAIENSAVALSSWWLAEWSNFTARYFFAALNNQSALLGIYAGISIAAVIFTGFRSWMFTIFCVRASNRLHHVLLKATIRFPQSFFDTSPLGRVLNRFTKDIDTVDVLLPQTFQFFLIVLFVVVSTAVIIAVVQPIMIAALVPVAIAFYFVGLFYRYTSVELQRLESVSRSPIFAQLSETLGGVTTIRAFGQVNRLRRIYHERCDKNQRAFLTLQLVQQWLGLRLDVLGELLLYLTATLLVLFRNSISAALSGYVLSSALGIMSILNRVALQLADTETKMNSIERVMEFTHMPQEPAGVIETNRPPANWPSEGTVTFEKASMRYRDGLPLVVQDLSVQFKGGEKIGVVGRTGAGKSSVMLLLFRIVEAAGGRVLLDGIDVSQIGLDDLRSKLAIIPQEPFLFSGTLRDNLDPFHEFEDAKLWDVLELVQLKQVIEAKEGQLLTVVAESGENFSVGQRQLICLGRALLRGSKVLLMDEATASVDVETDRHIQETVRREFRHCTVITIAHRLNTIMDYDQIMVMHAGKMVEYGPPAELLKTMGTFTSLVESTGAQNAEYLRTMAVKHQYLSTPVDIPLEALEAPPEL